MGQKSFIKIALGLCLALGALGTARASGHDAQPAVLPPISLPMAQYLATHPEARQALMTKLADTTSSTIRFATKSGGTWTNVTLGPKPGGFYNPILLTDGTVIVQSSDKKQIFKLTPDINGSYANGKWSKLADLPVIGGTQYAPLYHASAVLPDGRLIFEGGEYNGSSTEVWTNLGAIYDPVANSWAPVPAPTGTSWSQIGDAQSIVLPSGQFMLASCCAYKPEADALFNPQTLGWSATGAPIDAGNYQDEQGYELLPDGNVLTIDIWTDPKNLTSPTNSGLYRPGKAKWDAGPALPVALSDQRACETYEIGPAVMRGDGTLFAFGANTGCASGGSPIDPTAILDTHTMTWAQGPSLPAICGKDGTTACTLPDAPAAVMPDDRILFAASAGYGIKPTHFFEVQTDNTIIQVSDPLENSTNRGAYVYSFLDLPNGQVLMSDFSDQMEVYTPPTAQVNSAAPIISSAPSTIQPGGTYTLAGSQLGGLTQGAGYGDDEQMATNYPIIRITNTATGHVFYARSTNFSLYSVARNAPSQATFTVPSTIETGASTLVAVANGVASAPQSVLVQ
jgi:hypothetical protein